MFFKSKKFFILLFLLLLILTVYIFITSSEKTPEGVIIFSGRIEGRETNVSPKIQGRIIKLYKDEGDSIRQGELLCEIDSEQLSARYKATVEATTSAYFTIAQSQAIFMKARALYEKAKNDYERYKDLLREELVSKSEFDRIKMHYESAQAEMDAVIKATAQAEASYRSAQQRLKEAQADLKETKIYSPTEGVILSRPIEVGEVVNPGTVLYVIVNLNRLYVKVYVPESDIGKIKIGLPSRVYIDAYPDRFFNGRVTKIYEQAEFTPKNVETKEERVKLVFGVEIFVDNPDGVLKPGMPADVVIKWKESSEWIKP